ncbi:unnamed protein product [Ambrosiozyma monospora]|uniref:Unnamed protein product n=1 Tax=Ambrosiozyma monospora TaxID=43982 RepID=A0A9W6SZF5_AMBMO|nr:unnamed protein product [Ambrosiozyma monospora]
MLKPCYIPPNDDDDYENLEEHEYKTIMNESFVSSYKHIAKISMSSLADLNSTNNNLASYSYPQEPRHSRSSSKASPTGKLNLTGSPSSSLKKSRSSSPLKRFKSLKKLGLHSPASSRSGSIEPEFNFDILKSVQQQQLLQNSPRRHNSHRHRKTASTISLRTAGRLNSGTMSTNTSLAYQNRNLNGYNNYNYNSNGYHLHTSSMPDFNNRHQYGLSFTGSDFYGDGYSYSHGNGNDIVGYDDHSDINNDDDDGDDDGLGYGDGDKSASSSVPSVVIGEYDREKWRVIKNKLISESMNANANANPNASASASANSTFN